MPDASHDALRAWFLGPRAENAELLERLVVESLRDHVFWRRNYHPEDGVVIHYAYRAKDSALPPPGLGSWPRARAAA